MTTEKVEIVCSKYRTYTRRQLDFLKSRCLLCCKRITGESQLKHHKLVRQKDHFGPCQRCQNHYGQPGTADHHVFEIHPMYFGELVHLSFPEAIAIFGAGAGAAAAAEAEVDSEAEEAEE